MSDHDEPGAEFRYYLEFSFYDNLWREVGVDDSGDLRDIWYRELELRGQKWHVALELCHSSVLRKYKDD